MTARYSLGIDIGGTFTDIVVFDHRNGSQFARKVLTTHADPAQGVVNGVRQVLREDALPAAEIGRVVHATTLFTNATIERKGAATGLITTEGFRDVLEIGRERKYELYDLSIAKPAPLAPRPWRREVAGRLDAEGRERVPLDLSGLVAQARALQADGVASVAVVFLHAYANPAHERAAAAALAEAVPDLAVSLSVEVAPEIREFERTSTTVVNAYIKPLAAQYLDRLAGELAGLGIAAPLQLMLSNGGLGALEQAKQAPVALLESGPAAGALAGAWFGEADGSGHVLAFDMGGTTAKLSLVDDGQPLIAYDFEAARQKRFAHGSGLPIKISTIELIEIGAGGGSIARLNPLGLLQVGPDSAGSEPGPACYGRGGEHATVTDANFVLGYLNPDFFAGGSMAVDMDAARTALERLAAAAGLTPEQAAWGVHDIANEAMAGAARVHIAERGKDPRRYALLTTGGGGPLHGYHVAQKLGCRRLIVPPAAGVASAVGLLIAPARVDRVATVAEELDRLDWAAFEARYAGLEAEARDLIAGTGLDPAAARIERLADIRYVGQAFEVVVSLPSGPYTAASRPALVAAFEAAYLAKFTRTPPAVPVEIINIRTAVSVDVPGERPRPALSAAGTPAPTGRRPVYFPEAGGSAETPVYARGDLPAGFAFAGPAVIEEAASTLIVGPSGRARVTPDGNLVVDL
ncbi:MAG: hydantoinase/oxoprolinase family protein [Alphaproteobacteria bacterium]|nr:hydantoinase/oxoprolinase family protein [Alphaproteobacteria bacterium]